MDTFETVANFVFLAGICFGIYHLIKVITNEKGYQIIVNSSDITTTNPIGSKIWDDRIIDTNSRVSDIYFRIEWIDFLEQYSLQINEMFEKDILSCEINNYHESQKDKTKIILASEPKGIKDFEIDLVQRIIDYINKSKFKTSPQDYFANHGELLKQIYKKTEKIGQHTSSSQ